MQDAALSVGRLYQLVTGMFLRFLHRCSLADGRMVAYRPASWCAGLCFEAPMQSYPKLSSVSEPIYLGLTTAGRGRKTVGHRPSDIRGQYP